MRRPLSIAFLFIIILLPQWRMEAQEYPFRDTSLPAEERIDNLLSLMTIDEKIASLQGMGVPRLGVPSFGSTEAIHGIVRGGATTLPPLGASRDERRREGRTRVLVGASSADIRLRRSYRQE